MPNGANPPGCVGSVNALAANGPEGNLTRWKSPSNTSIRRVRKSVAYR